MKSVAGNYCFFYSFASILKCSVLNSICGFGIIRVVDWSHRNCCNERPHHHTKRNRLKQEPRVFHVTNLLFHLLNLYTLFALRLCIPAQLNWWMDIGRIFKSEKWEKEKWFLALDSIDSSVLFIFRKKNIWDFWDLQTTDSSLSSMECQIDTFHGVFLYRSVQ